MDRFAGEACKASPALSATGKESNTLRALTLFVSNFSHLPSSTVEAVAPVTGGKRLGRGSRPRGTIQTSDDVLFIER